MIGTLLLNRYKLLEKIGEGGMGIVYKAKCTLLNRFVAIKILKAELSNYEDFLDRFKREANSIASLSHPNIVNIHDIGSEDNINFIVMEYVNGETLKQAIKRNSRLSSLETVEMALQIAKGLEYAHKNNIIHRDIKPDNILITDDNIVKLTDFGIAKVADSVTITNSNKIIGSVHYFSPEQAKGRFVDCRTDIYALGIVMYEMITGQVPFKAELLISVAMMHIQETVIPPKEIVTDMPDNINSVILKTLEKEPINRFQTASELINVLNAIKNDLNVEVNFKSKSIDATTIMMTKPDIPLFDTKIDSTVVMDNETIAETMILNNNEKNPPPNNNTSKNKKIMLTTGLIVLAVIIGILSKYLFRDSYIDTNVPDSKTINIKSASSETTVSKENIKAPENEKKLVPSLVGKTQADAENIIRSNGFLLGNITNEYSDNIPKGSIINQSPAMDTQYEKNGKINLIVSQGQKISQVIIQINEEDKDENEVEESANVNKNGNGNAKGKDKKAKNNK